MKNLVIFIVSFFVGWTTTGYFFKLGEIDKDTIVKHHAAHYDSQTGAFTWNDQKEDK